MKFKNALKLMKEVKYLYSLLKRYGGSLVNGRYYIYSSFRAMTLDEKQSRERSYAYFNKSNVNHRLANIAKFINKTGCFYNRKKSTAEYDAIYTANNYDKLREIKLFSFRRNKILTICTSPFELDKQLTQYECFRASYNMPTVNNSDRYPNSFEVSMITLKTFPGDIMALDAIYRSTVQFNPTLEILHRENARELIKHSYDNEEINSLLQKLCAKISDDVLDINIPFCTQHGDLSKDNLLYGDCDGKLDFWWIDWEHARERLFFYDYFFYILNSAMYYDTKAYDCYMNGEADEGLKSFFSHFGLEFDPHKRKDYFLLFAVVFLKERVCDFGRTAALKAYSDFIESH